MAERPASSAPTTYAAHAQFTMTVRHPLAVLQYASEDAEIGSELLPVALPGANRGIGDDGLRAIWIGPDRWLLVGDRTSSEEFDAIGRVPSDVAAVTDLSDARVCFRLFGDAVRRVLAKGCPLDLDPGSFAADDTAQSVLGLIRVLLDCRGAEAFDVFVARSYARSLGDWLVAAAAEYIDDT